MIENYGYEEEKELCDTISSMYMILGSAGLIAGPFISSTMIDLVGFRNSTSCLAGLVACTLVFYVFL